MKGKFEVDSLVLVDQGDMHWVGRILKIFKDSLLLTENIDPNDDYDGGAEFQQSLCTPIKRISLKEQWRLESCETCRKHNMVFTMIVPKGGPNPNCPYPILDDDCTCPNWSKDV